MQCPYSPLGIVQRRRLTGLLHTHSLYLSVPKKHCWVEISCTEASVVDYPQVGYTCCIVSSEWREGRHFCTF
jgi:hypothetical protein